jgi:hypothetical protein
MRLIEQVGRMLAGILALRKVGRIADAARQVETLCEQNTGLRLELVKRSAPETILQLLKTGGGTEHVRAVLLAELLLQDAEMSDDDGKNREAAIRRESYSTTASTSSRPTNRRSIGQNLELSIHKVDITQAAHERKITGREAEFLLLLLQWIDKRSSRNLGRCFRWRWNGPRNRRNESCARVRRFPNRKSPTRKRPEFKPRNAFGCWPSNRFPFPSTRY